MNGGTPSPLPKYWGGDVRWATPVDLSVVDGAELGGTVRTLTPEGLRVGSSAVPAGSVLLSTRAPIGYSALTRYVTAFNQGCKALVPSDDLQPRFLLYVMQACKAELSSRGQGTTFLELPAGALGSTQVPVPPVDEQRAIADFLDRETAEIDAFIADQEELIGLLTERRAAVHARSFEAVVNIDQRSNPGIPLGRRLAEVDERVGAADRTLFSVSIRHGVIAWSDLHDKPPKAESFVSYKKTEPGDVVLNRMRAFQGAAGVASESGMVSPDYAVFRTSEACSANFVGELLRSAPMVEAIKLRLRGIGEVDSGSVRTPRVNSWDLLRIRVNLPDLAAQERAFDQLRGALLELDAAIADAREAIALSKERRAALISAAVTGKIDVRGAA